MTQAQQYNAQARRRIASAVEWVERYRRQGQRDPFTPGRQLIHIPTFAIASEDIEHGSFGDCKLAGANSFDSTLTAIDDRDLVIYNPGDKIWAGSPILYTHGGLAEADYASNVRFVALDAWSATLIRGTATAGIAAGSSGTLSDVVPLNGHYPLATAPVTVPTGFPAVTAGAKIWAALAFVGGVSRWEAIPTGTGSSTPGAAGNATRAFLKPRYFHYVSGTEDTVDPGLLIDVSDRVKYYVGFDTQGGATISGLTHNAGTPNWVLSESGIYLCEGQLFVTPCRINTAAPQPDPVEQYQARLMLESGGDNWASSYTNSLKPLVIAPLSTHWDEDGFQTIPASLGVTVDFFSDARHCYSGTWLINQQFTPPTTRTFKLFIERSATGDAADYGFRVDLLTFTMTKIG